MRVLVTGGARRIGAAIVRRLVERGHAVAIHHHASHEDAQALQAELAGQGSDVVLVAGDLADPVQVRGLVQAAASVLGGPVDGLVNNASIFEWDALPLADYAALDRHMHVNLGAPLVLASALAAQVEMTEGAIVNLLDQKVGNLNPDFLSYTCSKLALAGATEMLARALAPRIRVNAVSPGLTLPSLDQSADEFAETGDENLLRRPVDVTDLAAMVEHLLVTRSITGQNVFVDCGQRFLSRDGDVMFAIRERPHG